jgi:hypothetical protein
MSDFAEAQAGDVLPPDGKGRAPAGKDAEHASEVARIIAHWMDEFIRIPGTQIRMGLDPIIGLIPGIGGLLSSSVSLVVMVEAVRHRVSPAVFLRMGLNIGINEVLDAIPVVGDAASIFFKIQFPQPGAAQPVEIRAEGAGQTWQPPSVDRDPRRLFHHSGPVVRSLVCGAGHHL